MPFHFSSFLPALAATAVLAGCAPNGPAPRTSTPTPTAAATPATATGSAKVTTASGIVFEMLQNGSGPSPAATDTVKVHYRGTFPDGREFDSSYQRGQPTEFPLNRVIPCWTEAVQMMKPGGKARITCPPRLAYGERGAGSAVPPNATLNFEIELISIAGK